MQHFCAQLENKALLLSQFSGILLLYPFLRSVVNIFMVVALLALAPIGLAVVFLYRTLAARQNGVASLDQSLVLAPGKYRPMERLLQEEDFRFLSSQPGFSARLGRRFRTERRRVFRAYLRSLSMDFGRVSKACQILVIHAAEDRDDLAKGIIRARLLFALGILAVEGRLLLHAAGVGTVDVRGLVESLETMQAQIQVLLTPPEAAMARL
jgi:hypothetical protein